MCKKGKLVKSVCHKTASFRTQFSSMEKVTQVNCTLSICLSSQISIHFKFLSLPMDLPSKKRYSKANKYKKGCSTSLVNREMQINTKQECKVIQPSILGNFSVVSNKSKHLPYGLKIHSSIYTPKTDGCIHTYTHTHTHTLMRLFTAA